MGRVVSTERVLTHTRFNAGVGLAAVGSAAFAVWVGLRMGGVRLSLWVDDGFTPIAALMACVLCWLARGRHAARMRLFWTLLGCATACWTLAETIWGYYALIANVAVPVVSWADLGYLSAIPLTVAALVVHPRHTAAERARRVLSSTASSSRRPYCSSAGRSFWARFGAPAIPAPGQE